MSVNSLVYPTTLNSPLSSTNFSSKVSSGSGPVSMSTILTLVPFKGLAPHKSLPFTATPCLRMARAQAINANSVRTVSFIVGISIDKRGLLPENRLKLKSNKVLVDSRPVGGVSDQFWRLLMIKTVFPGLIKNKFNHFFPVFVNKNGKQETNRPLFIPSYQQTWFIRPINTLISVFPVFSSDWHNQQPVIVDYKQLFGHSPLAEKSPTS